MPSLTFPAASRARRRRCGASPSADHRRATGVAARRGVRHPAVDRDRGVRPARPVAAHPERSSRWAPRARSLARCSSRAGRPAQPRPRDGRVDARGPAFPAPCADLIPEPETATVASSSLSFRRRPSTRPACRRRLRRAGRSRRLNSDSGPRRGCRRRRARPRPRSRGCRRRGWPGGVFDAKDRVLIPARSNPAGTSGSASAGAGRRRSAASRPEASAEAPERALSQTWTVYAPGREGTGRGRSGVPSLGMRMSATAGLLSVGVVDPVVGGPGPGNRGRFLVGRIDPNSELEIVGRHAGPRRRAWRAG